MDSFLFSSFSLFYPFELLGESLMGGAHGIWRPCKTRRDGDGGALLSSHLGNRKLTSYGYCMCMHPHLQKRVARPKHRVVETTFRTWTRPLSSKKKKSPHRISHSFVRPLIDHTLLLYATRLG
jgi:hypothetical protein